MNVVIESVELKTAMEICKNDKSIKVQPVIDIDGTIQPYVVDIIINDVCSIKQIVEYDGVQMITKLGHITCIKYTDYLNIKIL